MRKYHRNYRIELLIAVMFCNLFEQSR